MADVLVFLDVLEKKARVVEGDKVSLCCGILREVHGVPVRQSGVEHSTSLLVV